jgi:hypothetical protein
MKILQSLCCVLVFMGAIRSEQSTGVIPKSPARLYSPLGQFGMRNLVDGIDYPDWFGARKISVSDREYLVSRFNRREWLRFTGMLQQESEMQIKTKDGRVFRLQPLLDALAAVAGALNPESSQVSSGDKKHGIYIQPREGFEQDTPSAEETSGKTEIETIDKELRWYRQRKYHIPPSISEGQPGVIHVIAGTYGQNCGVPQGNKTGHLARACNGRASCSYVIDYQIIGDPAYLCAKTYIAEWQCGNSSQIYKAEVSSEAGYGKTVTLACTAKH